MRIFSYIISILLIVLGVTFAILNSEIVKLNFYLKEVNWPLSLILVLTLAIGVLIGLFIGLIRSFRLKK